MGWQAILLDVLTVTRQLLLGDLGGLCVEEFVWEGAGAYTWDGVRVVARC